MRRKSFSVFPLVIFIVLLTGLYQSSFISGDEITIYKTDTSNYFTHVAVENNNSIWFGSGETVFRLANNEWQAIEITPYSSILFGISCTEKGSYFAWGTHLSLYTSGKGKDYILPTGFSTDYRNTVSMVALKDGSILYGCDEGLLRLVGDSWTEIITGPFDPHGLFYPFDMVQAPDGSVWIGRLGQITHIDKNLQSIVDINPPAGMVQAFRSIAVDKNSSIWLGTDRTGLIISYKENSWNVVHQLPQDEYILDIKIDLNNILWVCTKFSGLLRYDGITWKRYTTNDGLPSNQINEIAVAPDNTKWIATPNGAASLIDSPVGVNQISLAQSAVDISASPNPFNSSTTITFTLSSGGPASLSIYSITGQKVLTLVDGPVSSGVHAVKFDGSKFGSGLYFYRFTSDKFTKTGKMLLLK